MGFISFIKKHRLYKYVKENNSLLIFFLTAFGTAITFVFRGLRYLYYYAKYKTLQVPVSLITDKASAISISITIIEILLATISVVLGIFFVSSFKSIKSRKAELKKKEYLNRWLTTIFLVFMIMLPINYSFMILQGVEIGLLKLCLICVLFTGVELYMINVVETNIFGEKRKLSLLTGSFISVVLIGFIVLVIFLSGVEGATRNTHPYQILSAQSNEYVVLETFDDKYVVAECEEKDNTLTIHTDEQKVISFENVEYENRKFDSIILEGNK